MRVECNEDLLYSDMNTQASINAWVDTAFDCVAYPTGQSTVKITTYGEVTAYVFEVRQHEVAESAIGWAEQSPGSNRVRVCAALVEPGQSVNDALRAVGASALG